MEKMKEITIEELSVMPKESAIRKMDSGTVFWKHIDATEQDD